MLISFYKQLLRAGDTMFDKLLPLAGKSPNQASTAGLIPDTGFMPDTSAVDFSAIPPDVPDTVEINGVVKQASPLGQTQPGQASPAAISGQTTVSNPLNPIATAAPTVDPAVAAAQQESTALADHFKSSTNGEAGGYMDQIAQTLSEPVSPTAV